ncbi:photosystem II reaction center protein Psb28 [Oscillatoria sp. CS-180]|uniref:photosystem II reaction center protein Psb28 n=1 Tax=Oscillatoria sp. CS-180 TaxID=3021720 RepID=UPI00232C07DA|nr:photosystem II reaction center protein Psb28 [Oscillatoria sp. CS-180]MDB9528162.1 photosystem II reaction center protein Psb28 [Oscillatoria sp. CS-180]
MASEVPTVEFFDGISEEISNVSLRQDKATGDRIVLLLFERLQAIEEFKSFRSRFSRALRLTDSEGIITIEPSGVKFIFTGPEGDDLKHVECTLEIDREDHWDRFMRFMHRYAEANGMAYGEPGQ